MPITGKISIGRKVKKAAEAKDVRLLVDLLADPVTKNSTRLRRKIVQALGASGDAAAVPAIAGLMTTDPSGGVQIDAAIALGEIADPRAIPQLKECRLAGPSALSFHCLRSLSHIVHPQAEEELTAALSSPQAASRSLAAEGLGRVGGEASVPNLIRALEDPKSVVRISAAEALAAIGDGRAIEPVRAAYARSGSLERASFADPLHTLEQLTQSAEA